ncbi:proteasome subunit alpha type 1 [Pseudohyphozyma bogoriensis]|nr:proteasome subunit alpha type 1 [Pseudohyphozyma bogoriensis]
MSQQQKKRPYGSAPGNPPLPPGPPPPPPAPPNPYAAYGYGQPQPPQQQQQQQSQPAQQASHPQYPGYGYGGQQQPTPAVPASPYPSYPSYPQSQPATAAAPSPYPSYQLPPTPQQPGQLPANPYGAYGTPQAYAAATASQGQQQQQSQQPNAYQYPQQPQQPNQYGAHQPYQVPPPQPGPPPIQYQPQQAQQSPFPGAPPLPPQPSMPSPQGAPPFKRTRAGPSSGRSGFSSTNVREPRKERKWGSSSERRDDGKRDEAKKTLTDFRIMELECPELKWQWKGGEKDKENNKGKGKAVDEVKEEPEEEVKKEDEEEIVVVEVSEETTDAAPAPNVEPPSPPASPPRVKSEENGAGEEGDMSIDIITPADVAEAVKADDVAKDESVEASTEAPIEETKPTLSSEEAVLAPTPTPAVENGPASTPMVASTSASKKNKHGRDDEEEALVITDVTAKKVKADTGEVVTLSSSVVDVPMDLSLPAKPQTLAIPTGPAADRVVPPPAAGRENSRLRIYFSSPVSSSQYVVPEKTARAPSVAASVKEEATSTPALDVVKEVKKEDGEATSAAGPSENGTTAEEAEDVDGEDVDGVAVDGEAVDGEELSAQPVVEADSVPASDAPERDSDEDDSEAVSTALLSKSPAVEPVVLAEDDNAKKNDVDAAPSVTSETSSYPPVPYPQGSSTAGSERALSVAPVEPLLPPEPAADRISISYARNTRRMVIDADVVEKVTIFRAEGRIEVSVRVLPATLGEGENAGLDVFRVCKGILVEALDPEADDYVVMDREALEDAWRGGDNYHDEERPAEEDDTLLPPLHHLLDPNPPQPDPAALLQGEGLAIAPGFNKSHITIVASLDRVNPLTEARWVKTGEVDAWILSLSISNGQDPKKKDGVSEWKGKIHVYDPDPPPTIQHALETWATSSTIGSLDERTTFVKDHMSNIDNVFEILLRLTRGDRAGPSHHSSSTQPSSVGAMAAVLSAPYAEHQTQVSLAVLAMFRLSVETAAKAGIPTSEIETQVAEIIRGIPYHLIFKSLDGMWREQRAKAARKA